VQVPGYLEKQAELKSRGIDEVLLYCVNDAAVMKAWAKDQAIEGSMMTMLADPGLDFTTAVDMVMDHPGPVSVLGGKRCKRFAMYLDDGVVKIWNVSEGPDDPAGDNDPSASLVENMIKEIDALSGAKSDL
jgi:peroxiredoxin